MHPLVDFQVTLKKSATTLFQLGWGQEVELIKRGQAIISYLIFFTAFISIFKGRSEIMLSHQEGETGESPKTIWNIEKMAKGVKKPLRFGAHMHSILLNLQI